VTEPSTLPGLLDHAARKAPGAPALSAPQRPSLAHGALLEHVRRTAGRLAELGIGRRDAVAIVLPNGPEMASAFVSLAAAAVTAPLNPAYRADEYGFYLDDLAARALVVPRGSTGPAADVAAARGIPILDLVDDDASPAGHFSLEHRPGSAPLRAHTEPTEAAPDDVALVLHTSGTTSRPKLVPLSHRNLCASAGNIRRTLALEAGDVCLNIMPLFHIHGLMAALLASLSAGASVACTPGFNALRFFQWLEECGPTWYTAVPSMHQAIVARAARNAESIARARLRFIRSSSASLPPQVFRELEARFGVPAIEAYAMTEAAHQMCSNPLPPGERKPGSVGLAAGPEVAIMAPDGTLSPHGETGEIVIRGENVTSGYVNDSEANAAAFAHGWFHTGDQGTMDRDGYVRVTGRLKEIINRGGEKVSPLEVDAVLLEHPAVAQICTFAMPHPSLGEEVAAAVVLAEGAQATERELRAFASARLADFKVPRKFVFCDEIPKGATGKLQRIGLAAKLGLR
jgi:acyl-CoA synthetase (AMP-forming)/AMP-acid ligase II